MAPTPLRAGKLWRFFTAADNVVISVLYRAGYANHATARHDLAWDGTGLQALTLLGL